MPVLIDRNTLHERFQLAKRGRSHVEVAPCIGVHRNTLEAFVDGRRVSLATLEAIHAWIETEETRYGYTVVRTDCR